MVSPRDAGWPGGSHGIRHTCGVSSWPLPRRPLTPFRPMRHQHGSARCSRRCAKPSSDGFGQDMRCRRTHRSHFGTAIRGHRTLSTAGQIAPATTLGYATPAAVHKGKVTLAHPAPRGRAQGYPHYPNTHKTVPYRPDSPSISQGPRPLINLSPRGGRVGLRQSDRLS